MKTFIQSGPSLENPYENDPVLDGFIDYFATNKEKIREDLKDFSNKIINEIEDCALQAEKEPPEHIPYSPWGERIDEIKVSPAWKKLDEISAQEGLIALGYERDGSGDHRFHQYAKMYLFHPSSAFYSCPLAMTDGAAKLIETHAPEELANAFGHLTSKDPSQFWTSGQWMTEKTGGSDVGASETLARFEDGQWGLYGIKWFTSATTSQMTMTLARIENENGEVVSGGRGLSLFYVELRDDKGRLKNILVNRLKDKLGTKALPTAEITLNGTPAKLLGERGRGIPLISSLFNITRIGNSIASIGSYRRSLELLKDYSKKREAFGKKLIDHPLHQQSLNTLEEELCGLSLLSFFCVDLLGKEEINQDDEETKKLLRLLTPVTKLYVAKKTAYSATDIVELFGGAGYVEDTGIPKWLRDGQVFSIWEGTTNILSLDTLRAIQKDNVLEHFFSFFDKKIKALSKTSLEKESLERLKKEMHAFQQALEALHKKEDEILWQESARKIAFSIAELSQAILLADLIYSGKVKDNHLRVFRKTFESFLNKDKWVKI